MENLHFYSQEPSRFEEFELKLSQIAPLLKQVKKQRLFSKLYILVILLAIW